MTDFKATVEQQNIIDAAEKAQPGDVIVVQARAGSGKTTTAVQIAKVLASKKVLYLAFNKSTQLEFNAKGLPNVESRTSHSLAYGFGAKYRHRMTKPMGYAKRVPAYLAAQQLGVPEVEIGDVTLEPARVLRIALGAVGRFARSADTEITKYHVRWVQGLEDRHDEVVNAVLPVARQAWNDIKTKNGVLNVQGEHYIKMWQLSRPSLTKYDVIVYDEAQDANGAVMDVVKRQGHAIRFAIGDSAQAINGWNGAVDALAKFEETAKVSLPLSQSFRFGQAVADEGNKFLALLGVPAETLVKGFDKIDSKVEALTSPDAVLCRTNGGCIAVAIKYLAEGRKVAIVGGGGTFKELAEGALQLQSYGKTSHPDLANFKSWQEVQKFVKEDEGADLRPFVKIIDETGAREVVEAMGRLTYKEEYADVVVSTMHKAKGREWKRVQIHTDCPEPKKSEDGRYEGVVTEEQAMLYYVAVTRAQEVLDNAGLAWIDEYLAAHSYELAA